MTAIHQSSIASHHSVDDTSSRSGNRNGGSPGHGRQANDDGTWDPNSSTVNISSHAQLRLRAYQEQRMMQINQPLAEPERPAVLKVNEQPAHVITKMPSELINNTGKGHSSQSELYEINAHNGVDKSSVDNRSVDNKNNGFPQNVALMLSEVEDNLIQTSEPGYQYLVNVLNNHINTVEDPQQLQEVMRKEQFFLTRRKPFMESSDFQSYSQVLGQFANIVERQQYSF